MEDIEVVTKTLSSITQFAPLSGFYSLGFLAACRPDIHWIDFSPNDSAPCPINDKGFCDRLDIEISTNLKKDKIVCLLIWDEDALPPPFDNFAAVCNRYRDERFYLVTQLGPAQQKIYTHQGGLKCKIIEIPWWWLNDCVQFYAIGMMDIPRPAETHLQFLCMTSRPQEHKTDLITGLYQKNLHGYGKITVNSLDEYPKFLTRIVEINPHPPYYHTKSLGYNSIAAITMIEDVLISANVENFAYIDCNYDMPLIINAETTTGIFLATEKSLWPALLGRMYLIHGQPGSMAQIQRFHDVDQTLYCDTSFDSFEGDWSRSSDLQRLEMMLDSNRYLIMHAREIYQDLRDRFQSARWTIGDNILRFCLDQLGKIA